MTKTEDQTILLNHEETCHLCEWGSDEGWFVPRPYDHAVWVCLDCINDRVEQAVFGWDIYVLEQEEAIGWATPPSKASD